MYGEPLWELVADLLGGVVHEVLRQQLPHHSVNHLFQCEVSVVRVIQIKYYTAVKIDNVTKVRSNAYLLRELDVA